jgi:hypothetical protein
MCMQRYASGGFFLVLVLSIACIRQFDPTSDRQDNDDPVVNPSNMIQIYPDQNDIPLYEDPAWIQDAEIQGDSLMLVVEASGGCAEHDYELFGCHCFMESFPVQTNVYLSHDAHNDPCEALIIDTLRFDLAPLKDVFLTYYPTDETVILRIIPPGSDVPIDTMLVYGM